MKPSKAHPPQLRVPPPPPLSPRLNVKTYGYLGLGVVGAALLGYGYSYRKAIKRRVRQMKEDSLLLGGFSMVRGPLKYPRVHALELNPSFRSRYEAEGWRFTSLGEYFSSLRPGVLPEKVDQKDLPQWIQNEIEAGLAAGLIRALGPSIGRALLPTLGFDPVNTAVKQLSSLVLSRFMSRGDEDRALIPVTIYSLIGMTDANATRVARNPTERFIHEEFSSIQKMKLGEFGQNPSFAQDSSIEETSGGEDDHLLGEDDSTLLVPNPFIISEHWEQSIRGMERQQAKVKERQGQVMNMEAAAREDLCESTFEDAQWDTAPFDPHGRKLADPMPIDERIFPGLHMGWGDAKCTHTNREVIRNRLLSVLLNRLGSNYYYCYGDKAGEPFAVKINRSGETISRPSELIEALIEQGHDVQVYATAQSTTFGVALCVKEVAGGWSNIPLACVLQSGYEDASGRGAPAFLPHSGLNLEIRGPLLGTDSKCSIQHYMAVEGLCGWHSNHNADVPWIQDRECGKRFSGKEAVQAFRMAALYGVVLNAVGSEMDLPFGGYGLTGVCNDTAAVLEHALNGSTSIYPLTSVGRFMFHSIRYARCLRDGLAQHGNMDKEVADLHLIIKAMKSVPSDLNASPGHTKDAARRMLYCLPEERPFELMDQTQEVIQSILKEVEERDAKKSLRDVMKSFRS